MNNEDILELCTKLNIELCEQGYRDGDIEFSVESNGFIALIKILGITIWHSDEDDRDWDEKSDEDEYEPLEDYLRREFANLQDRIFKIDLGV